MLKNRMLVGAVAMVIIAGVCLILKPNRAVPRLERAVVFSPDEVMSFDAIKTPQGQKVIVTPATKRRRAIASEKSKNGN